MKRYLTLFLSFLLFGQFFAQTSGKINPADERTPDLSLFQDDIIVLPEDQGHFVKDGKGAHLFVRKRGDIESVSLLIDSSNYNDPDLYLMRAKEKNAVNGNEIRYSYGSKSTFKMERLPNALISSTVENTAFGECFHIYIPKQMYYGYVIQVQDECEFEDGMKVSIRAFASKYCDIAGVCRDNKLFLNLSDWQTEESFAKIASTTDGKVVHVLSAKELPEKLISEIEEFDIEEKTEVVFAIDATASMKDDFTELKKNWLSKFEKQMKNFRDVKIGLLLYKDYGDEFKSGGLPVKNYGFFKKASVFSKNVKNSAVSGGGDKNEAVYEALYSCCKDYEWSGGAKKKVILIGDAAPHPAEKTNFEYNSKEILAHLAEKGIVVDCFLISDSRENNADMKSIKKSKSSEELLKAVERLDEK